MKAVSNSVTDEQKLAAIEKQKIVAAQREEDKKRKQAQEQYRAELIAKAEGLKLEVAVVELEARYFQADADKQKAMFEKMDYFMKNIELAPAYNDAFKAEQAKAVAMQKEQLELARAKAGTENNIAPDQSIEASDSVPVQAVATTDDISTIEPAA